MIHVFTGPTLHAADVRDVLNDVEVRPPARAGDIYAACQEGASGIGLIDGYFDGVPSVWHKEILFAIARGIPVFGASSMGALRAAELHSFGMIGVGAIFEAFRDGTLEDDDEVALQHGPADLGYVALSVPMVNIRTSLERAVSAGVLEGADASCLVNVSKKMHFPERSWDSLVKQAKEQHPALSLEKLQTWLPTGAVDQKRLDALDMVSTMAYLRKEAPSPPAQNFEFQHTAMWETLTRSIEQTGPSREVLLVLDQLHLDPNFYADLRRRAASSLLSEQSLDVAQADVGRAMTRFRAENRLYTGQALESWLAANDLDVSALQDQIADELRLTATIAAHRDAFRRAMIETLKADGSYAKLLAEAKRRAVSLDRAGLSHPEPSDLDINPGMLLIWYFEQVRDQAVPDDLAAFIKQNDFADRSEFEQMMARAYVLWQNEARRDDEPDAPAQPPSMER
ncbi:TfuA-like protein [Roseobacter sp. MH60115]|uniref:TfuA-like protein n=1 Tax=Roseobacter sp. MH60115 TaxID=2785324 RepID=UPI0018A2CF80|nr:TfuA-like protein [Roseobacter sp. MH60115]